MKTLTQARVFELTSSMVTELRKQFEDGVEVMAIVKITPRPQEPQVTWEELGLEKAL